MLAQNLKTAVELKIPEKLYGALLQVLGLLEREEIPKSLFSMRHISGPRIVNDEKCGTAGCIAGWCEAVSEGSYRYNRTPRALEMLFYPNHVPNEVAYGATREQAAFALRTYLTTGKDGWKEAMELS